MTDTRQQDFHDPAVPPQDQHIRDALDDVERWFRVKDHRPVQQLADDIIAKLVEATMRPRETKP